MNLHHSSLWLSHRQRILVIIHLCLALSVCLWYWTQPFMGAYFNLKSRLILYEYVMGTSDIVKKRDPEKLQRNLDRFMNLSNEERAWIFKDYQQLEAQASQSATQKLLRGFTAILGDIPPFEKGWIFFSILISILILLRVEGSKDTTWILVLLTLCYCYQNFYNGHSPSEPADTPLFPKEEVLVQHYLSSEERSLLNTREQLEKGWERYLIQHWSPIHYSNHDLQIEEGEFYFTIARLKNLRDQPLPTLYQQARVQVNPLYLLLYLIWNVYLARQISRWDLKNQDFSTRNKHAL